MQIAEEKYLKAVDQQARKKTGGMGFPLKDLTLGLESCIYKLIRVCPIGWSVATLHHMMSHLLV